MTDPAWEHGVGEFRAQRAAAQREEPARSGSAAGEESTKELEPGTKTTRRGQMPDHARSPRPRERV